MIDASLRRLLVSAPVLPPPVNENDGRMPTLNAQSAHFKQMWFDVTLKAIEAAEARLAALERGLKRKRLKPIRGDRR